MNETKVTIRDCCVNTPEWIFVYDNHVFTICEKHFTEENYRTGTKQVINIKDHKSYKPAEIFGE